MTPHSLPIAGENRNAVEVPPADAAASTERLHLLGVDPAALGELLKSAGHPAYRGQQILDWIYRKHAADFADMSNLSKDFRAWLAERTAIQTSTITRESVANDGTRKLLLTLPDGAAVETVWIPADNRNTACISSQVGCPVGCRFCASGLDGVERNLTAGEIVEQAWRISRLIVAAESGERASAGGERVTDSRERSSINAELPASAELSRNLGERHAAERQIDDERSTHSPRRARRTHASATGDRLSNIVMMGMGEPLANYANVIQAVRILNAAWGMGVGARKITVSTVGLPAQIRKLAGEGLQVNLALSLHATDDRLRHDLIPWGKGIPIAELMDACAVYFEKTGREVTFEYVLLRGVNDHATHAAELARLARRVRANVNLLRYNPVPGVPFDRPSSEAAFDFQAQLRERGVNVHIRTSRGMDADAACGQLRRSQRERAGEK